MTWIKNNKLKETGCNDSTLQRCYGWNNDYYPRLTLSIHTYNQRSIINSKNSVNVYLPYDGTFTVSVSKKEKVNGWWEKTNLPDYLIGDLIELLQKQQKLFGTSTGGKK